MTSQVHIYSPDYGCSRVKSPCLVCGFEYDKGDHYLQRPCPVCGSADLEATSYPELVHHAVSTLIHRRDSSVTRAMIADRLGIKPSTLKKWEYTKCSEANFFKFTRVIRDILEELGAYDSASDGCSP